MVAKLRDRDWDVILDNIELGRCVVQLGPDLCVVDEDGNKINLASHLSSKLAEMLEQEHKITIDDPYNLRLVAQIYQNEEGRDYLNSEVRHFYENHDKSLTDRRNTTFESLSALPFRLYVTSRHDTTLDYFMREQGRPPKVKSYNYRGDRTPNLGDLGTVQEPLIYRLYGSIDEPDSMVLTENDLLDFLVAVVSDNPGFPTDLKNLFEDRSFLFLGFGLGNYYLRILLHVLEMNKSDVRSFALENPPVPEAKTSFERRFRESVFFYDKLGYRLRLLDVGLGEFVHELRERWDRRHPEGSWDASLIRPVVEPAQEGPSVFISYVKEDEERASQLSELLRTQGLNPWIDLEGLRVGDRWDHRLEDTVNKEVDYFVVLQSRALSDRVETYVHEEVKLALERQIRRGGRRFIFPMKIDEDAETLDAISREKIQVGPLYDWNLHVPKLVSELKRDYARQRRA